VNALFAANLAFEKRRADRARVRRVLDACLAHPRLHRDALLNAAFGWIYVGDADQCIAYLRKAKSKGVKLGKHLAEKAFAPLAADKRFLALKKTSRGGA
jgi:hypothetical protein